MQQLISKSLKPSIYTKHIRSIPTITKERLGVDDENVGEDAGIGAVEI